MMNLQDLDLNKSEKCIFVKKKNCVNTVIQAQNELEG